MKKVLVLGAGLVSRPLVRYLLDHDFKVIVASRTVSKAEALIDGHPNGEAKAFNITKEPELLDKLIPDSDLAISLLPYVYHVNVAEACLKYKKHMVTTSYVSEKMEALNDRAKEAGLIILNEVGVDPGIDHMSAMKIIHHVEKNGGKVTSFRSYCGGLPAPDANNKPFGYKFSWSPRGVLMAGKNDARYLEEGKEVYIPGKELFDHYKIIMVDGVGQLEAYPNRNSLPYIEKYGLKDIKTMFRGTYRNHGWCKTLKKFAEIGILEDKKMDGLSNSTFKEFTARLTGLPLNNLKEEFIKKFDLEKELLVMNNIEWIGLFSDEKLPDGDNPLDILVSVMLEKLQYDDGERDMIVLCHEFIAEYRDKKEFITSTLIDFGIPHGDTSMARTVSLPAAVATRYILEGKFDGFKGVLIPVMPEIYEPVLKELERLEIVCKERFREI